MPRSKSAASTPAPDRESSSSPVASTSSSKRHKGKTSKRQKGKKSKKTDKSDKTPSPSSSSGSPSSRNPSLYMTEDSSQEEEYEDDDYILPDTAELTEAHRSPPNLLLMQRQQMLDRDEDEDSDVRMEDGDEDKSLKQKRKKPGIIYLSSIPAGFNVTRTTEYFSGFGKVGRVFLQPDKNNTAWERKYSLKFTEGWIEFFSKRVAKEVASKVNSTPVGGKKKSQNADVIWNIKYLPRFKWAHLTERLNYEKATHQQKLRHEIGAAKKESDHFKRKLETSKRAAKKASTSSAAEGKRYEFRMKSTDEEIRNQKRKDSLDAVLASAAGSLEAMTTSSGPGSSSSSLEAPSPAKKKRLKSGERKASAEAGESSRREFLASVFGGPSNAK